MEKNKDKIIIDSNLDKDTNTKRDIHEDNLKKQRRHISKQPLFIILFTLISSALLFGFGLFWQWRTDFLAIINAFYVSAVILFAAGFVVYASNENVFSPLVYGVKSFFLMFAGKKPKLSYYDYVHDIKENPAANYLIFLPLIASVPNFVVAIILNIIYSNM